MRKSSIFTDQPSSLLGILRLKIKHVQKHHSSLGLPATQRYSPKNETTRIIVQQSIRSDIQRRRPLHQSQLSLIPNILSPRQYKSFTMRQMSINLK